jgi:hypothetical protein
VKRFTFDGIELSESPEGELVRWEDHERAYELQRRLTSGFSAVILPTEALLDEAEALLDEAVTLLEAWLAANMSYDGIETRTQIFLKKVKG